MFQAIISYASERAADPLQDKRILFIKLPDLKRIVPNRAD